MAAKKKTKQLENFSKPEDAGLVVLTNGKREVSVKPMHVQAYEFMGYKEKQEPVSDSLLDEQQ